MFRVFLIIAFLFVLNACVSISPELFKENDELYCKQLYHSLDVEVHSANVRDVQTNIVKDFPFLSADRFLTSFRNELETEDKFQFWLSWMAQHNRQARLIEWRNLPQNSREKMDKIFLQGRTFESRLNYCSELLKNSVPVDARDKIILNVSVPMRYSGLKRILGVYPLTALFVSRQIKKHQSEDRLLFSKTLNQIEVKAKLHRYIVASEEALLHFEELPQSKSKSNPLGIPEINHQRLSELFRHFAPELEIDQLDNNDIPGQLQYGNNSEPEVNTKHVFSYVLPSFARFKNQTLLQLNYLFWFASRPKISSMDIYGGKLDGLIWRVTLNSDGKPLLFDSVHACGCYHKFFISDELQLNQDVADAESEPPFVAQIIPAADMDKTQVIRLSSGEHYVQRVHTTANDKQKSSFYSLQNYHELRSLSAVTGFKSAFAENGLIKGTERGERWLLWPMGVLSPGAMRQWGHHAVAFVGKRHFDDPFLINRYFSYR